MEPPTLADLSARIQHLEHQSATILFLSAANMFANAVTVVVAVLVLLA